MSYSGDAAEQVVRMSLETGEVAVKLAGAGAKQLAVLLYAILREQTKTKGKTRLTNMLRSGKELKVFAVKDSDLQLFCREAKKYGVLYCVLKDKNAKDGIPEIETPDDGTEYLDITGQYIPYDTSNMVAPDSIEVHVTVEHLLWVYLLGIVLCTIAVTLASVPIVKMKPKNILSQMS